jgi:dihydroxyacetone kinase-like predicted kinase
VGPDRAAELGERLEEEFPDIEFEFHPGGPDLYPYLVALE